MGNQHRKVSLCVAVFATVLGLWGIPDAAQSDEAPLPATTSADSGVPADESDFLRVRPLPEGIEEVKPIPGAVNTRFIECKPSWPDGYKANEAKKGTVEYRNKADIYRYLYASHAFETRDCGCTGKVAAWGGVDQIYDALKAKQGEMSLKDTADFASAAQVYFDAVEKMCGGRF